MFRHGKILVLFFALIAAGAGSGEEAAEKGFGYFAIGYMVYSNDAFSVYPLPGIDGERAQKGVIGKSGRQQARVVVATGAGRSRRHG